jgi:hypothetical protein
MESGSDSTSRVTRGTPSRYMVADDRSATMRASRRVRGARTAPETNAPTTERVERTAVDVLEELVMA